MRRLRPIQRHRRERDTTVWPTLDNLPGDEDDQSGDSFLDEPEPQDSGDFAPFVPVSGRYESYVAEEEEVTETYYPEVEQSARRRRVRVPGVRPRVPALGVTIRWGVWWLSAGLIAAGIVGTLLVRGDLRAEVEEWWPAGLIAVAGVWMLAALLQREVAAFLGGAAFAGVGLSWLMHTQDIAPADQTLLGMVLITSGLGIVIRGFLLRQRVPAR